MSQKVYLTILKAGVYLSLLSVFLVFKDFLFPYITSKQIYFNILIEVLLVFWLAFIIKYPEYKPKKSWMTYGLIGFFAALFISCLFSVDFNLSFWGDVERMLGVFHLLHILVLYFIIITVFRDWKDWKILFLISIGFAVIVSIVGLAGKHYSTIGNTAYVSGYLIFNIYFALLLLAKEKNQVWRWLYLIPIIVMLFEFKKANTTGAYVGFGFSIFIVLLLYAILNKNKKVKITALALLILIITFTSVSFMNRDSDFIKHNSVLRIFHDISFQKNTFQTRLISWKAALKDFPHHPIVGTGHGNYAITFDKHFDPSFYNYTRTETYFDRAHNNLIDIISTTGTIGFLTYISIFMAAIYYLYQGYRREKITIHQFVLIMGLMVAYFVQNLAVFDSLVTYIALMMTLGFIYWFTRSEEEIAQKTQGLENKEIFSWVSFGVLALIIIWQFNINVILMLKGSIQGQILFANGMVKEAGESYKEALGYNTILDRDSRDSFIRFITNNAIMLSNLEDAQAKEMVNYAVELAKKNVLYNEHDSLMQMQLAQILDVAARLNQDKFYFYSDQALAAINKSIEASPGRIRIYFSKAQIYLTRGEKDKAIGTLEYAVSLNEDYPDSICNLAKFYFFYKEDDKGYREMDKCIDKKGAQVLAPVDFVVNLIKHYEEKGDNERILKLYQQLSQLEPNNSSVWVSLAKLYAGEGKPQEARQAAERAAEIDPSLNSSVQDFIRSLE